LCKRHLELLAELIVDSDHVERVARHRARRLTRQGIGQANRVPVDRTDEDVIVAGPNIERIIEERAQDIAYLRIP